MKLQSLTLALPLVIGLAVPAGAQQSPRQSNKSRSAGAKQVKPRRIECGSPANQRGFQDFPRDTIRTWPISTRVNEPENDYPSIVEPIEPATSAA
jgi:hypothetical protein